LSSSAETKIHPTAILSADVEIGAGVEIGPYAILQGKIRVGDGCKIHAHAQVLNRTTLGAGCVIHGHALVGGTPQDRKFGNEDTAVEIGDETIIREGATVHLGTEQGAGVTAVGKHCLIMANAHVAHDCRIEDEVTMSNNVLLAGHVHVQFGATISGASVVHQFTTIGRLAMIGGLARVAMDVPPFLIVEGRPGKVRGLNVVGLRRRGISEKRVERLKEAYRYLFTRQLRSEDAIHAIESGIEAGDEVEELLAFLRRSDLTNKGRYLETLRKNRVSDDAEHDLEHEENHAETEDDRQS
jgi:UDP-N-acetylglucosamine acyltransferase